jgi:hypothetical protein
MDFLLWQNPQVAWTKYFIGKFFNTHDLDSQQGVFKLTMKSNAIECMVPLFDLNLLTKMWCLLIAFEVLVFRFLEYVKLIELAMVQILNNVEDNKCFSTWLLWSWTFIIGSLPIYHLCTCLYNSFIFCKISHTRNALCNGKQHAIDIV